MTESDTDSWLIRHPITTSFLLVVLYLLFILLAPNIAVLEGPPGEVGYFFFMQGMIFQAFLWLIIVPRFLKLPDGALSLRKYLKKIRLLRFQSLKRNLGLAILCSLIILSSGLVFSMLTGYYVFDLTQILPPDSTTLFVGFVPGIWEEVAWRGVILTVLLKKYSEKEAIVFSSILFAGPHLLNLLGVSITAEMILGALAQLVYTFFLGLLFAYLVIRTDSLLPAIVVHYVIVAIGPLVIFTPGANPLLKSVLLMLGAGIASALCSFILIHFTQRSVSYSEEEPKILEKDLLLD
ncbi:MAG: lysostaphin resistance A-like protein [Candidatus Thorarchaeota archaeon]